MRRIVGTLACALALAACATMQLRAATPTYRLVGYVVGAETLPPIPAEELSALNFAFAHIDARGRVALDQTGTQRFLAGMRALKSRNPRLQIVLSVGGWGADGFSDAAATPASRLAFADSAADALGREDLDGIDIDWEYPGLPGPGIRHRDEDRRDFTLLLAALRTRFDALARERGRSRPYLITAALADSEFVAHIELDRIHAYLDWINLMTYDFHNSLTKTTGHHSALARSATSAEGERSVEHAVAQFLAAGVPADKLVVGVPFYGRAFADVAPRNDGLDQPYGKYAGEFTWPQLADLIDKNGYVRHWDDTAHEPYLWNAQTRTFVSYDDPQSLALKAAYVRAHHLGGMMYWEQSQDPGGALVGVLARGLRP
ncbi:MAG TPA: glycoside hydrolase family 18 protein [Rudaea sp.]|nr:glycoside hydrolase family 18 protein [Rudaea sp.]